MTRGTSTRSTTCGSPPGVGYNAAEIKARMSDAPVDSWRMIFDPAVVAKFADCGVSILDAPSEVLATALIYIGRNPNSNSAERPARPASRCCWAIRPYVRFVDLLALHRQPGQRRHLPRHGLVRGHQAGARPAPGGAARASTCAIRIPREGAISQLRRPRHTGRRPARERTRTCSSTSCCAPDVAAQNSNLIKYANAVIAGRCSRSIRRCATTRACSRRRRCAPG